MKKMKKRMIKIALLFLLVAFSYGASHNPAPLIKRQVSLYFQKKFNTSEASLHISYLRLPDVTLSDGKGIRAEVYSQRSKIKLGYQTLWVKILQSGKLVKKFPVSVDVSLQKQVLVAGQKIKFHAKITPDMLTTETRLIRADYGKIVSEMEEISGMEAKQVIGAGSIITTDVLRRAPLIHRNQKVNIKIESGALVVSTEGIARGEGVKGEMIFVRCSSTGKVFKARILGPGDVLVPKEYAL